MEGHERVWRVWQERFAWLAPHWIVYGFVGGVMAIAYHAAGLYALAVFAVPLLLMRKTQEAYLRHTQKSAQKLRAAAETIQSQNVSLEQANRLLKERSTAAMESLSATVDARDAYTAGHSRRVQQLALAIGRELGLSQAELDLLGHAALFHDIGKLAVPDAILLKPAVLTDDEWSLMQRHSDEGARIIDRLGFLNDAVPAIRHHHERFDGTGYPDGLKGEEIPLGARIIHVADALDSMLTTRIYRAARPAMEAMDELKRAAGSAVLPALRRTRSSACCRRRSSPNEAARHAVAGRLVDSVQFPSVSLQLTSILFYSSCHAPETPAAAGRCDASTCQGLAEFQAGIRKRYSDEEILEQLRASAERLGRSPTMREFEDDAETTVHPQTVIQHFGSWNDAKRKAGLVPRRFAEPADLIRLLRELGEELGRPPTARGPRRAPRVDAVEVALLAHVRLAQERASRGRLRHAGGGGAAGAGDRAGSRAGPQARTAAEVRRLEGCTAERLRADERVAGLPDARAWGRGLGDVPVPRPRAAARGWGGGVAGGPPQRAATIAARRRRHDAPSCGARTAGSDSSSKARSGLNRSARAARRARARATMPSGSSRFFSLRPRVALRRPRARPSWRRRTPRSCPRRARAADRRRAR